MNIEGNSKITKGILFGPLIGNGENANNTMSVTFDRFVNLNGEEALSNDGNLEGFFALKGEEIQDFV